MIKNIVVFIQMLLMWAIIVTFVSCVATRAANVLVPSDNSKEAVIPSDKYPVSTQVIPVREVSWVF